MSALLHTIIVGIENERISNGLRIWKSKSGIARDIIKKNEERHKLDIIQSFPYKSVQKYITRFGPYPEALHCGHFQCCCDDCEMRFHGVPGKNYLMRSIHCMGDYDRRAWDEYQLCNTCLKKYKVFYCGDCCEYVLEDDWYYGYECCRRCGDEDDDTDSDGYDTP